PGAAAWSAPENLGGVLISDPAVGVNSDGSLEVFAIGSDQALYHARQTAPGKSAWSGWGSLGGQSQDQPAVSANADGRLEVFIHTTGNSIWHSWEQAPSGNWAAGAELVASVNRPPSVSLNS